MARVGIAPQRLVLIEERRGPGYVSNISIIPLHFLFCFLVFSVIFIYIHSTFLVTNVSVFLLLFLFCFLAFVPHQWKLLECITVPSLGLLFIRLHFYPRVYSYLSEMRSVTKWNSVILWK